MQAMQLLRRLSQLWRPDYTQAQGRSDLGLGTAATADAVAFAGASHEHPASAIASGVIDPARLAGGTPAAGKYPDPVAGWTTLPAGGGGGSATPGGSAGQLQYNNAGAFAGASGITTVDGVNLRAGSFSASKGYVDCEHFGAGTTSGGGPRNTVGGAGASAGTNPVFGDNTVFGAKCESRHDGNTLFGSGLLATLGYNCIYGLNNISNTFYAILFGGGCSASNDAIGAMGYQASASHPDAFTVGWGIGTDRPGEFVFGSRRIASVTPSVRLRGSTAQFEGRDLFAIETDWAEVDDPTRKSRALFYVWDADAKREAWRSEADGAAVRMGFFGSAAVARPVLSYSRAGEDASTAAIRSALASLGFVTDSTTA